MVVCKTRIFIGKNAPTEAATFLETIETTRFLGITGFVMICVPAVMVVYKDNQGQG